MASTGTNPPPGSLPQPSGSNNSNTTGVPPLPSSGSVGSNTTGTTGRTPAGSETSPPPSKPTTFDQLRVRVKSNGTTSSDRVPVDLSFDRLVTIDAQTDGRTASGPGQSVTIRDVLRFNLSENLSGEATLSDVIYPSSLSLEVLGGDGIPKVQKDVKITKENNEGVTIELTQADTETILRTSKPPPKQDAIIQRPAIFVEIAMDPKSPKANFANASLLVAPLHFAQNGSDWTRDGFAKALKSEKGPITIAQPLTSSIPTGIASLPWTESRLAVDGRFIAKFIAGDYDAWAWLLTGARSDSILGVIANDDLKADSAQVRSIILPPVPAPADPGSSEGNDKGTPSNGGTKDCHCDSGTRVPAIVSETELANNPGVYTEDPGSFCKPFSNPERILSERSFYSILRTEQPVLSASASSLLRNPLLLDLDPVRFNPTLSRREADLPRLVSNLGVTNQLNIFPKFGGIWDILEGGRYEMSAKHPMQWEGDSLRYQATTVAMGHILEFRLRTRSNGYSLGGVAKTLTLAPRQTKRIQKIEWSRTERALRVERTQLTDATNDSMTHDTSYQDAVGATLNEWSQGSSSSSVTSAAAGGGLALGPVVIGGGVATSSSKAQSQQRGGRDTTASEESQWRDAIRRHGDALRKLESMVVQEVTQSETVTGTTEVIRNINYAHSLTVVYHNILRHLRVDTEFAAVRECLFVPLAMRPFTQERALRWRETLARVLKDRKYSRAMTYIKDVVTNFTNSSIPPGRRSDHPIRSLWGSLYIDIGIPRPGDGADGKYDAANWVRLLPYLPLPALSIWQQLQVMVESLKDQAFQQQYAPAIARKWCDALQIKDSNKVLKADFTLATEYRFNGRVRVDFTADTDGDVTRETLSNITVLALNPLLPGSIANVVSLSYNYETDYERGSASLSRGTADLILSELGTVDPSGASFRSVPSAYDRQNVQDELRIAVKDLVDHLNEYVEYYHKAIWWNMDRDRLFMLIDGFTVPKLSKPVSIANVVERDPIAFAGNSLVFRVSAGVFLGSTDPKLEDPDALFNHYNTGKGISVPMHISLPTDGLYAQTILDECNALEEHYGSYDWALNNPDPDLGLLDASLLATRRADPPKTDPTPFPSTIINLSNATPAPGPQGVAGALNAVQNANAFRDMAGLAGTQQLAQAGLTAATSLATSFGASAAALKMADTAGKQQAVQDADKKLASISRAKDKQLIPSAEAEKQAAQVLQDMSGSQPAKAPHEDPAIQTIIKSAKDASDNGAPASLEASTSEGSVSLNFGIPESVLLASNQAGNAARRPRPNFETFRVANWDYVTHPDSREVLRALNDAWVDNTAFSNTCTMRISRGLNYSGVRLPRPNTFPGLRTFICKDGRPYAIAVAEMRKYLTTIWGPPDFNKDKQSGVEFQTSDYPELSNHNGIITFNISFGGAAPATGHFDIWNGVAFSHELTDPDPGATDPKDYWKLATKISLWYLPIPTDVQGSEEI